MGTTDPIDLPRVRQAHDPQQQLISVGDGVRQIIDQEERAFRRAARINMQRMPAGSELMGRNASTAKLATRVRR